MQRGFATHDTAKRLQHNTHRLVKQVCFHGRNLEHLQNPSLRYIKRINQVNRSRRLAVWRARFVLLLFLQSFYKNPQTLMVRNYAFNWHTERVQGQVFASIKLSGTINKQYRYRYRSWIRGSITQVLLHYSYTLPPPYFSLSPHGQWHLLSISLIPNSTA